MAVGEDIDLKRVKNHNKDQCRSTPEIILQKVETFSDQMKLVALEHDPNEYQNKNVDGHVQKQEIDKAEETEQDVNAGYVSPKEHRPCGVIKEPQEQGGSRQKRPTSQVIEGLTWRTNEQGDSCGQKHVVKSAGSSGFSGKSTKKAPSRRTQPPQNYDHGDFSQNSSYSTKRTQPRRQWRIACMGCLFLITCCPSANAQALDQKRSTTCTTSRAVFVGKNSEITCLFRNDVRADRLHFSLVRYDFDNVDTVGDLVLSCIWNEGTDTPACAKKEGYSFDPAEVGNNVTITIRNTKANHAGRYFCNEAADSTTKTKPCALAVKGSRIFCDTTPAMVVTGQSAFVRCVYNVDLQISRDIFYIYRFNNKTTEPVKVLFCKWDVHTRHPDCKVEPGYTVDSSNITNVVMLRINSATEMHSGRYSCRVIPFYKVINTTDCALEYKSDPGRVEAAHSHGPDFDNQSACLVTISLLAFFLLF
ncbi:uncharacterized protein [Littorina saxatilis]|uniref:Immunoglobulin domain-containing protein n=1 Tax=Littorina saxatilis TaxID=31220 RepID=A0AAN9BFL6_9CAEN